MSLVVFINGSREVLSPTPSTTLAQILQTVCAKKKLDPTSFNLTYNGKVLDLSMSYRLSGLAKGAKLEAKRKMGGSASGGAQSNAQVRIALQLPEGERLQGTFPADTSLWNLLKHFEQESGGKLNFTERVGPLTQEERGVKRKQTGDVPTENGYLQPVINFMQSEISTNRELKALSLGAIGVSGSGLLRLLFRQTGLSLSEVSEELSNIEKEQEVVQKESKEKMMEIDAEEEEKKARMEALKAKAVEEEQRLFKERLAKAAADEEAKRKRKEEEEEDDGMAFDFQAEYKAALELEYAKLHAGGGLSKEEQEKKELEAWRQEQELRRQEEERQWLAEKERKKKEEEAKSKKEGVPEGKGKEKEFPKEETAPKPKPQARSVIPPRDPQVFPPADKPFDPREFDVPEDFYDLTPGEFSSFTAKKEEEKILRTKEMREKERLKKIGNFVKTIIRIRFPNRVELQGTFHPREKPSAVVAFVKERLEHPDVDFYLFTTPPKQRVDLTKNMLSQLFVPAAIFYFSWEADGPQEYLKKELMEGIEHLAYVPRPVLQCSAPETTPSPSTTPATPAGRPAGGTPSGEKKEITSKEPPKWFMMGKKK